MKLSRPEARALVHKLWQEFLDKKGYSVEEIKSLVASVNDDLTIRDYFLGLPCEVSTDGIEAVSTSALCGEFVSSLALVAQDNGITQTELVPFMAIVATFFIDMGEQAEAITALQGSLYLNPDYSLSKLLLQGVIQGSINAEVLTTMRSDLHAKVTEAMAE